MIIPGLVSITFRKLNPDRIKDASEIASIAASENIKIAFEYHCNTFSDTCDSAIKLIKDINSDNCFLYWQPENPLDFEKRKNGLEKIVTTGKLLNIHVFHWKSDDHNNLIRLPLKEGRNDWSTYLNIINSFPELRVLRSPDTQK